MKHLFISICAFLITIGSTAQEAASFTWSEVSDKGRVGLQDPHLVLGNANGFITYSAEKSNLRLFTEDIIYIHKFDANGKGEALLNFELPKRLNREANLLKVVEGKNKLYFFSYLPIKKDGKNILYVQIFDNTTQTVSEAMELFTLPIKKVNNSGFMQVAASPDNKVMTVLINHPFAKKTQEKIEVLSFDENLNPLQKGSHMLSFKSKRVYHETLFVDNAGAVSIVKKTDITKKRPITTVISIKQGKVKEQKVSAEKFYVSGHKVITINEKQYLFGFATNNAKPAVTVGGAKDNMFFMYNISDESLITKQEWSKETIRRVLGKGFTDIQVKDIFINGETVYLLGDCYSKKTKEVEGKDFVYDYIHRFGPGVVIKMNMSGEVAYDAPIKYNDEYKNELNVLSSYCPFLQDGELFILMNEKESLLLEKKPIVIGMAKARARTIVLRSFDANGKVTTTPFWNSKVGRPKDVTKFAPSRVLQVSNNEFYVYAVGGIYHRFGKMILK